jgi:hypothetical protein
MKLLKYCLFIGIAFSFAACLKDKGNYIYREIPSLYIDTVGSVTSFDTYQSIGKVTINPKVVYTGNVADLRYLWRLYASGSTVIDTLSRQKNIDVPISRAPGAYLLELQATDTFTGRKALMQYSINVLPPIPSGWMVAYETAEGNTDVDIIRSPEFITTLTKDTILRKVFSGTNGTTLAGSPVSILYQSTSVSSLYTTTGGALIQNTDFKQLQNFQQTFVGSPPAAKPEAIWPGSFNGGILVNNKQVYWSDANAFVGKLTVDVLGYEAAPFIYVQFGQQGGFYDQLNMRFCVIQQQTSQAVTYTNASASARFNLNNIGKKLLFIERGFMQNARPADPYKYAFFKNVSGNGRFLYVINTQTPLTPDVAAIDISTAPNILNAQFYGVGNLGPAGFYATSSSVYYFTINYSGNSISTPTVGFSAPAGEQITNMTLLKAHGTFGVGLPGANDSKFMFLATYNQTTKEGKVYLLNVNVTSGQIAPTPLKVWGGLGKVGAMFFKGS